MTLTKHIHYFRYVIAGFCLILSSQGFTNPNSEALVAYQQGDYATALNLWNQASLQGDVDANFHLAELYRLGQGVAQSNLQAESYYLKAAQNHHTLAQLNLARLYYFGALGPNQLDKAFFWINEAAQKNNADAQWMLGGMYFNGDGVEQDSAAAYSWLTLASEQNHLQAALSLAKIQSHLTPEERQRAEQLTLVLKAKSNAQHDISEQEKQAFYWFHKAALQNDAHAQWLVGKMYLEGQGVIQDKVAAYSWLTLASEQQQSEAELTRIKLRAELSPEQIASAEALTQAFKQNPKSSEAEIQPQLTKPVPTEKSTVYRVQLASLTSQSDVEIEVLNLKKRLPNVIAKQQLTITEPNPTLDKPDFYRIQIGRFVDKAGATKLCEDLRQQKQACFVVKTTSN